MRLFQRRVLADIGQENPEMVVSAPSAPLAEIAAAGLVAVGAALVIWAYRKAPTGQIGSYDPIFWAGMVLAYLTVAWRAICGRHTVIWLAVLGLFTVLPKFWMSPSAPIYFDEIAHFALLQNVISGGTLFQHTPLLPIGTYYPGMESVAASIHWLTGLSPWNSAMTLIAAVHSLLLVQVYYIARALQVPHRWAAVAGLVYGTAPSFIYGDAQFAYESVGILLLLTIVRLYVEGLAAERSGARTWKQSLSTALLIGLLCFGCVVTHHLTSFMGAGLLMAGALFIRPVSSFIGRRGGLRRVFARWAPVLMLGGCLALWIAYVAPSTAGYLSPHVSRPGSVLLALVGIGHAAKGAGGLRVVFSHSTAPAYEQAAGIAANVLVAIAFLLAVIRWLRKPRLRSAYLWSLVVVAFYLVSLPLTLTAAGDAGARRSWATTFIGVSLLPAALAFLFELDKRSPWLKRLVAVAGAAALVILLIGNVAAGEPVGYRFPGKYTFASDTRSVTPETIRLAGWVHAHLGSNAHVVTDRFTALTLTARADAITPLPTARLPIQAIFYDRRPPSPSLMSVLQQRGDDYLVIDKRIAEYVDTPADPPLFVTGEPAKVPLRNISRLARWPWLRLRYSSTHYRLYAIDFASYHSWYRAEGNVSISGK